MPKMGSDSISTPHFDEPKGDPGNTLTAAIRKMIARIQPMDESERVTHILSH